MAAAAPENNFFHPPACDKVVLIGLVGDVAGGKTTVARRLAARGAGWIDADRLAHRCLGLPWVRVKLRAEFGDEIFAPSGFISRRRLAARVFGADAFSDQRLQYLQRIVHPPTRALALRRITRFVKRGVTTVVLDAPLLLEATWDVLCDEVWCVRAPLSRRVHWAAARGWSEAELAARQQRQIPTTLKELRSTRVLDNQADRASLIQTVDRVFDKHVQGRRPLLPSSIDSSQSPPPSPLVPKRPSS